MSANFAGMTRLCGLTYQSLVDISIIVVFPEFQYAPEVVVGIEDVSLCSEIAKHLPLVRLPHVVSEQSCCCGRLVPEWEQNVFQKREADSLLPYISHCYWHCCLGAEK
jgi:hypothetical protein